MLWRLLFQRSDLRNLAYTHPLALHLLSCQYTEPITEHSLPSDSLMSQYELRHLLLRLTAAALRIPATRRLKLTLLIWRKLQFGSVCPSIAPSSLADCSVFVTEEKYGFWEPWCEWLRHTMAAVETTVASCVLCVRHTFLHCCHADYCRGLRVTCGSRCRGMDFFKDRLSSLSHKGWGWRNKWEART
jgi:hypothetical protein